MREALAAEVARFPTLVEQSLKTVDETVVILVAVEDIKDAVNELVLLLDESVQEVQIFLIIEVIPRKLLNKLQQLLLVLRDRRHGPLHSAEGLTCATELLR